MRTKRTVTLVAAFLFAACGGDQPGTHTHADGTVHSNEPPADRHTERTPCGDVVVGEHTISVFQLSKIEAGKEGDFDLVFAAGQTLPGTVRGWIGIESAQGSMKVRFEKEDATTMHGHPEAPKTIPEGSKLWIEVESSKGTNRAAIAFRP